MTAKLKAKNEALKILETKSVGFQFLEEEESRYCPNLLRRRFMALVMSFLFFVLCLGLLFHEIQTLNYRCPPADA